ncbi:homeobox domain containing protein [Diplodia corticola]|uniref:Homeobox domain containing protein n=1 Tax=Diplodia corticola TaxID=236234 RepID=A0A1J9R3C2_9PEZI|nr:homeobox domain containing protein [Diplodia corticola]OJD35112.1 homeobox domain containing protein [Diplodia corticola]
MIPRRGSPYAAANAPLAMLRRRSDTQPMGPQRAASTREAAAPVAHKPSVSKTEERETNEKLQEQWSDAICRNMNLPKGYAQVAVLIVKWAEHLDELRTAEEVEKLTEVFRDDFHYVTVTVSLDDNSSPQHQLVHEITGFLKHFDDPNNLLIIYYTGHAGFDEDTGELEFYARKTSEDIPGARYAAQCAGWNSAESLFLQGTQADTLAILDTCYASNVTKGAQDTGRAYQLLAASGPGRMTAGPGRKSFTTAMIESLKECLNENGHKPFSLWKLSSKINEKQYRRQNPCFPHDRLKKHDRQIELAPLKGKRSERDENKMALMQRTSAADLTLRFALGSKSFTREHIEKLTRELPKAYESAGLKLQRIDWVGLEERPPIDFRSTVTAFSVAHRWLQRALPNRKRSARLQEEPFRVVTDDLPPPRELPQPHGASTNVETAALNNTELDSMHAEATPPALERGTHRQDPDDSNLDAVPTPPREQAVSDKIGSVAQVTAAVIGMGLLSCVTTVLCTRAALKSFRL